jgi:hypothetical protein
VKAGGPELERVPGLRLSREHGSVPRRASPTRRMPVRPAARLRPARAGSGTVRTRCGPGRRADGGGVRAQRERRVPRGRRQAP